MAVLSSTLLPLRLFLCFGLLCSSASSADDTDSCMLFSEVTTTGQGIMANSDVYESNTNYTGIISPPKCVVCSHPCDKTMPPWMMAFLRSASEHFTNIPFGISHTLWVPVNANITSVVLRAVDENNNSLGLWEKVDELCNNSVLYHLENPSDELFTASWVSPNSTNITTITLQAFAINFYDVATFSSLQLERKGTTTSQISTTRTTSHPTPTTKHISTTTTPHSTPITKHISTTTTTLQSTPTTEHISTTKTTPHPIPRTTNLANRTFLCPITSTIQILLVFLTSKLLS